MRKTKEQKGITLIALIITIIVLLILAVVAIAAVQDDGIIEHAKNARGQYSTAQVNENTTIQSYLDEIQEHVGTGSGVASGTGGNNTTGGENDSVFGFAYNESAKTASITGMGNKALETTEIVFPSEVVHNGETYTVNRIYPYAFEDNSEITSIVIPESITNVGEAAFHGCSNLASVTWNAKNVVAEMKTFTSLSKLTSFKFAEGLETISFSDGEIDKGALDGCTNLKEIVIPSTVTTISNYSFTGIGVTTITIPASVTKIGAGCFNNCASLTDIYCEAESQPEFWSDGWNGSSAIVHWGSTGATQTGDDISE